MVEFLDIPAVVSLQDSPVIFIASSSLTDKSNLYVHLRIQLWDGLSYSDTTKEDAVVLINGEAEFDISEYFSTVLAKGFTFPEHFTNVVIAHPEMSARFKVKIWETYVEAGVLVSTEADALISESDFYIVPGSISEDDQAMLNTLSTSWWDEWVSRKSFQHWLPGTKKTALSAVEKPYWIARRTATETVSIVWVGTDATTGTANTAFDMTIYGMYELCVSPAIAEQLAGKELASYTVTITGQSATISYTIDRSYYENQEYFLLANNFGCYETLWCRGARSGELEFARTLYERTLGTNYQVTDRKLGSTRAMTTRTRKSNTGWFDNESWFNWALSLLSGEDAWIYTAASIVPVVLTGEKSTYIDDTQEDPWALEIEWKHSREGRFGNGLGLAIKFIVPPYYSKLAAFFYRIDRGALVDEISALTAPQTGANIAWPNIAASDVLDFSDAAFWDQALIGATTWYNVATPRTCALDFMQGWAWAEASTNSTDARLFHKDYSGLLRSLLPVLIYKTDLTLDEQRIVVAWLEWYFVLAQNGSILTQNDNPITQ